MKLHLTSAYSAHSCLDRLVELSVLDCTGKHEVVDDHADADAILFVENTQFHDLGFSALIDHPLVKARPRDVFMYNEMDEAWPVLPGVYCSLERRFTSPDHHIAFPYLTASNHEIKHIYRSGAEVQWLYSFVGSSSHAIRKQVLALKNVNARIVDTSEFCAWDPLQPGAYAYQSLYVQTMASSKFVLCPRGIGPSSLRLYETMEAGRVPVIISDQWVAPSQVCWDFAVRVAESDISSIPGILGALESEWQDRAEAARAEWEKAYSPHQAFNSIGDAIAELQDSASAPAAWTPAMGLHRARVLAENNLRQLVKRLSSSSTHGHAGGSAGEPATAVQQLGG